MAFNNTLKLLKEFKRDTRGNFGAMAATTILGLMSAVGLSVDGQRIYSHSAKAQSVADAAGLAAAIHATSNGGIAPTAAAPGVFVEGQTYSAEELGFTLSTGETITFTVDYDQSVREVTVTTESTITPIMLQLIGKEEISSSNSSTVKYQEPEDLKPASILFVLDESGSMWFDDIPTLDGARPQNAVRRVDALRSNMVDFNTRLRNLGADNQNDPENQFLRTGVITYNNGPVRVRDQFGRIVLAHEQGPAGAIKLVIPMDWRSISNDVINNQISPFGGTESGPALQEALVQMGREKTIHGLDNDGNPAAERYVVFMSDGQNSDGAAANIWRAQQDTGLYRRFTFQNVCTLFFWGRCFRTQTRQVEERWDVDIEGTPPPSNQGWQEGVYGSPTDDLTVNQCTAMKQDGVQIYTIGFALQEGTFFTNEWQNVPGGVPGITTWDVDRTELRRAVSLLRACATDDSTFLLANDAQQLTVAFDQIGLEITEDIVRLTN